MIHTKSPAGQILILQVYRENYFKDPQEDEQARRKLKLYFFGVILVLSACVLSSQDNSSAKVEFGPDGAKFALGSKGAKKLAKEIE